MSPLNKPGLRPGQLRNVGVRVFLPDDATEYWSMNEGEGGILENSIGNSPDLTSYGGAWGSGTGETFETHHEFDEADDYAYSGGGTESLLNGEEYTYAMWVRYPSSFDSYPFHINTVEDDDDNTGDRDGWAWQNNNDDGGQISYEHNGTEINATGTLPKGEWLFAASTAVGDTGNLYVWDRSEQIHSGSGTASRTTDDDWPIILMARRPGGGSGIAADIAEAFASKHTAISEDELEEYWEETK